MSSPEKPQLNDVDESNNYVVQDGDTLQSIAIKFDVTVSWLLQINHMLSDFILPGDVIKVWKHEIDNDYIQDVPARLVDPNNIEGHSPHGRLFLYPNRIVFNAEIRDESMTIFLDGIKNIDLMIHPFNEVSTIPASSVNSRYNSFDGRQAPSSLPAQSPLFDISSPLSLKVIKQDELLYLLMINYDESKVVQSGADINVGFETAETAKEKFQSIFFSSMRKYMEPFKHSLITEINKRRIEASQEKGENSDELTNNNQSGSVQLIEDQDVWIPDFYRNNSYAEEKEPKKVKDKFKFKKKNRSDNNDDSSYSSTLSLDDSFKKRNSVPITLLPVDLIGGSSEIIKFEDVDLIRRSLPFRLKNGNWHLVYQRSRDGTSQTYFFKLTSRKEPLVMLIETDKKERIGAFLSKGIIRSRRCYGSGESFVFRFAPKFEAFKWSRLNDYFISTGEGEICIGGGKNAAIWIDTNLTNACSGDCDTFESPMLTSEQNFQIAAMELWSLDSFATFSSGLISKPEKNDSFDKYDNDNQDSFSPHKISSAASSPNLD